MNLRTFIIFVVMFILVAVGAYFGRVVEEYGQQNKDKWQVKKVATEINSNPHQTAN